MKSKRHIDEVIDKILEVVPLEEVEFRSELLRIKEDAGYKPPEGQHLCWAAGGRAFHARFGNDLPKNGWAERAVAIWMGTE